MPVDVGVSEAKPATSKDRNPSRSASAGLTRETLLSLMPFTLSADMNPILTTARLGILARFDMEREGRITVGFNVALHELELP